MMRAAIVKVEMLPCGLALMALESLRRP